MKNKILIVLNIFLLIIVSIGCIEYKNSIQNSDIDLLQLYSSFDAPNSLNISSVAYEDNLTKVIYLNDERETIILMIQPITSTSSNLNYNIEIEDTELFFKDFSGLYTYVWIKDGYTFSVVGTDEVVTYDFVGEFITHLKGF